MMGHKRDKYFIDRKVQGALARRVFAHWCVFFGLSIISVVTLEFFLGDPSLSFESHLRLLWSKYSFFVVLMVAIVPTFVYDSVKLSHRFAGPVMRLRESLHNLAQGQDVRELHFRDNDFWRELSSDFNLIASRLKQSKEST